MEGEETLDSLQSQVYSTVKLKKKSWQMQKEECSRIGEQEVQLFCGYETRRSFSIFRDNH